MTTPNVLKMFRSNTSPYKLGLKIGDQMTQFYQLQDLEDVVGGIAYVLEEAEYLRNNPDKTHFDFFASEFPPEDAGIHCPQWRVEKA